MQRLCVVLAIVGAVSACSNILVTPGASQDGSAFIGYAADSTTLYGKLGLLPAGDHPAGTMRKIYDWDSGKYLGEITEAAHTYNVVGNMNEHQLVIGETTFGGLASLQGQKAKMDYNNLMLVALQRAKTVREAIVVMGQMVDTYGYASEGESFSLADTKEVWMMEMIGKGPNMTGAVWVAVRIPDGHVAAHANQARITTFPLNDPDTAVYSKDVIQFARDQKLFNGKDEDFSFSDIYDPVTAVGARICEARVYSIFRTLIDGMDDYLDYLEGKNLSHRMPLSIPIAEERKLSLNDTFWKLRTHNEDSWFDNTKDEGAEAFHSPYRWRPLTWEVAGQTYLHERTISTQQTGWHFIAQTRASVPSPIGGILWFGVDDTATSVLVPFYSSITRVPASWGHPANDATVNGDTTKHSFDSAFWVFNMVANLAYSRWNLIYPVIAERIVKTESLLMTQVFQVDFQAQSMLKSKGEKDTIEFLTQFSNNAGEKITKQWLAFWQELFVTYKDGTITKPAAVADSPGCGCACQELGYDAKWYSRIAADTGTHYLMNQPENDDVIENHPAVLSKLRHA